MSAAASVARFSSSPALMRSLARRRGTVAIATSVAIKTAKGRGLYAVLGVGERASNVEIKAAYWTLAKRWHPDVAGEGDVGIFLEIHRAYATLSDPEERKRYDISMGLLGLEFQRGERFFVRKRWETDQCW
ncbi:chaperone protein dnaJ 11, chloroplastic-like [Phalaenopsis equestris]|uniref:chaperone protein dnaJ 11, chloroplastic-like n=1 Tax=Phalaenopsis equestris TaxID=78828 RepID=UPI0009E26C48|nr:chaperone protein dnaJ 11, chloroplastic-like [Phalaenopsis equestris]